MIDPAAITRLRDFLTTELELRQSGGCRTYVRAAKQALKDFEHIVAQAIADERARAVEDFDSVWPGHA